MLRRSALLALVGAAGACGGPEREPDSPAVTPTDSTPVVLAPVVLPSVAGLDSVSSVALPPDSAPVADPGLWDVASLEKRLDLQGMAPRKQPGPVRHPFLSVEGTSYLVGNAELQVFIYGDAAAVDRDVARLDTIAVAPRGGKQKWPTRATFIRNNNLAAILLGQNGLQIERVQRALMAGRGHF